MNIMGLDKFIAELDQAQKAIASLDGEIAVVPFNMESDDEFELEIEKYYAKIDERVEPWKDNEMVQSLVAGVKKQSKDYLLEKRAEYFSDLKY